MSIDSIAWKMLIYTFSLFACCSHLRFWWTHICLWWCYMLNGFMFHIFELLKHIFMLKLLSLQHTHTTAIHRNWQKCIQLYTCIFDSLEMAYKHLTNNNHKRRFVCAEIAFFKVLHANSMAIITHFQHSDYIYGWKSSSRRKLFWDRKMLAGWFLMKVPLS